MERFIEALPKAELHLHIEGTLEPEMMFELAARNRIDLRFTDVAEVRAAYEFTDLQSFLDIYYEGAAVLQTEEDFADLARAYLRRAQGDGVRHVEMFFDPQTHTERNVPLPTVVAGLARATEEFSAEGMSVYLIMCFLRHLSQEAAFATLAAAEPVLEAITGVGLDSSEVGNPPEKFAEVFRRARDMGLRAVAHAGEEGPPVYVAGALDALGAERIDHGVRSLEDPALVARLVADKVPLTVCPLSNVRLGVVDSMAQHPLRRMLEAGLKVTINSDDPAYFGGYVGANYLAAQEALALTNEELAQLARNSIEASFAPAARQEELLAEWEAVAAS